MIRITPINVAGTPKNIESHANEKDMSPLHPSKLCPKSFMTSWFLAIATLRPSIIKPPVFAHVRRECMIRALRIREDGHRSRTTGC